MHARLTPGFHSSYPFAGIMIGPINALTAEVVCPLTPTGTILPEISRFYRLPTAVTTSIFTLNADDYRGQRFRAGLGGMEVFEPPSIGNGKRAWLLQSRGRIVTISLVCATLTELR